MTMLGHQGILAAVAGGVTKGKTIFGSSPANSTLGISAGATRVWGVGTTQTVANTANAYGLIPAGTITDLGVAWTSTTTSGGSGTFINLVDTAANTLGVTVPSGAAASTLYSTGSVASNGLNPWQWTTFGGQSSGTLQARGFIANLAGTAAHTQLLGTTTTLTLNTASVTRYVLPVGAVSYGTVQAQAQIKMSYAGTIAAWSLNMETNTRTATAVHLTKNGVIASTITTSASTPGYYSATPGASFNAGDLLGITVVTGTGVGTFGMNSLVLACTNPSAAISDVWVQVSYAMPATGFTGYVPIVGVGNANATIYSSVANNRWALKFAATLRTPQIYTSTNSATSSVVATLMVNGVASGVSVTIPALTTGWVTGTGEVTVSASDTVSWRVVSGGGTGTTVIGALGLQVEYLSG